MKGIFFQKPFEFSLLVEGETWRQGDTISGTLTVKNHGAEPRPTDAMRVVLAYGGLTKVRAKASDAFKPLQELTMTAGAILEPGKDARLDWKFSTDRNAPITEKSRSLFVLYGDGSELDKLGQLQVTMVPYWVIEEFTKVLQIQHRFVVKSQRSSKGWVEVKLVPPSGKEFTFLEQLNLSFHFAGEDLEVAYLFNVKKVDPQPGVTGMTKAEKEFSQSFGPQAYLRNGRFNHDEIEPRVAEVIEQLRSKVIF